MDIQKYVKTVHSLEQPLSQTGNQKRILKVSQDKQKLKHNLVMSKAWWCKGSP